MRLRPVFSYLPASVIVLRCAAARWAVCRVSPFSPTFIPTNGNNLLKSNPFEHAKAPR